MTAIKYNELKRRYELEGADKTVQHFQEALETGQVKPEDFNIRTLAEVTCGREWVETMDPKEASMSPLEVGNGFATFANLIGQIITSKIREAYLQECFVVSKLVDTIPTEPCPETPDEIETPSTTLRGFITPVTRETIFFDRTHLILQRAAEVGEVLGLHKEKQLIDLLIGQTNNYEWKGTTYDTYQTTTPWINAISGNELVDWTDINAAKELFADLLDPDTGEIVQANTVLVMPAYRHVAHRICNLLGNFRVIDSRLAYRRIIASGETATDAKKWWFIGNFKKAFTYVENWPITVVQPPAGSETELNRDIVLRFKASERGAAAMVNPRYIIRCTEVPRDESRTEQ